MILPICLGLLAFTSGAPIPGLDLDLSHTLYDYHPPLYSSPVLTAPIIKTLAPVPIYSPPIIKTIAPAPILAHAPIIKAAPINKAIAPASSYATVTSYQIAHAPIITTIVAAPPILKPYAPSLPWGYH